MNILSELKRRNVFRVGLVYLASAWLIVQIASVVTQSLKAPDWIMPVLFVVLGAGFLLALVVAWLFELTPEGLKRTSEVNEAESIRPLTGRKLDRLFVIVFGLVVVMLLGERFLMQPDRPIREAAAPSQEHTAVVSATPSIAVLPFADLSPKKDQEYFADGISEEILNSLARVKDLRVTARTSSFYFKGRNENITEIAETLGVENILEGSVRKAGDEVRITAQLNNARTGYHLWSKTYDRKLDDIFAIQEDIAMQVTEAIGVTLGVGEDSHIPGMTRNVDAWDEILKAQSLARQARPELFPPAIEHARRAIALDPSFAQAWMVLRGIYLDGTFIVPSRAAEWRRKAMEAYEKVRALTPEAPGVIGIEAAESAARGDWVTAGAFFHERVPALVAKYGMDREAILPTGAFLVRVGRTRVALDYLERARAENPLGVVVSYMLGDAYAGVGNYAAAFREFERGLKLDGAQNYVRGGGLLAALATHDRALIDKWAALSNEVSLGVEDPSAFLDDPPAGLAMVRKWASEAESQGNVLLVNILAHWAAYYGDQALALELLDKGEAPGSGALLSYTMWRPIFADVRKLPGFKDLVREMGYPAYWRKYGWGDFCHPVGDDDFECS